MAKLIDPKTEAAQAALRRRRRAGAGAGSPSPEQLLGPTDDIEGDDALYRQLAENLQEVLWLGTPDWHEVLYVNPVYETLWGRSVQSLYDEPMSWLDGVVEEDRERVRASLREKLAGGLADPDFVEYRVARPDGSVRWVMARAFPIRNAEGEVWRVAGVAVDVTRGREAEEKARSSERDHRTLARNLPCVVYRVLLREGNAMRFYNDAVEELTGYPVDELTEGEVCSIDPLILDEDRSRVVAAVRNAVERGEPFDVTYRIRHADSDVRHFSERGRPVPGEDGRPLFIDGVIFDVTERAHAEQALSAARDELEVRVRERTAELAYRAEQLARLTSELTLAEQRERRRLARVLHDHLQQLLVGARLGLNVLSNRTDEGALEVVRQTEELIEQALCASRDLTVELSPPILQEAGLGAGLEWLVRRFQAQSGLVVDLRLEQEAEPGREDVAILLFEAVRELLLNVVKHAHTTSAVVEMRRAGDDGLQLVVADQGVGFDAEALARRVTTAADGFGLFSLQERLSLLGGHVRIDSTPGRGTRVELTAPRQMRRSEGGDARAGHVAGPGDGAHPRGGRSGREGGDETIRVLLVDDHVVMRQGLSLLLDEHDDIEVVGEGSDGEQAVELARQLQPAVILMDLSMPNMNGIEATRAIRGELPEVQVIGLSMYEERDRADAMRAAGAAAYLTKTGDPADLLAAIRRVGRGRSGPGDEGPVEEG